MGRLTRAQIRERVNQVVSALRELPVTELRGLTDVLIEEERDVLALARVVRMAQVQAVARVREQAQRAGALVLVGHDGVPAQIRGALAESCLRRAEDAATVVARQLSAALGALDVRGDSSPFLWPVKEPRAGERWVIREQHPSRRRSEAQRHAVDVLEVVPPRHETVVVYRDPEGQVVRITLRQWAGSAPVEWSAADEAPALRAGSVA